MKRGVSMDLTAFSGLKWVEFSPWKALTAFQASSRTFAPLIDATLINIPAFAKPATVALLPEDCSSFATYKHKSHRASLLCLYLYFSKKRKKKKLFNILVSDMSKRCSLACDVFPSTLQANGRTLLQSSSKRGGSCSEQKLKNSVKIKERKSPLNDIILNSGEWN